jgi:hypothetical protein
LTLRRKKSGYLLFGRFHANDEGLSGMEMREKANVLGRMWVATSAEEKAKWIAASGARRRR